jgi:hypothetical protein
MKKNNWKIQVAVRGGAWIDLENMPKDFEIWEAAEDWLMDNGAVKLEKHGLAFRIVPEATPSNLKKDIRIAEVSNA